MIVYLTHHFNPRSREGSDVCRIHAADGVVISIHAPAKGATYTSTSGDFFVPFQSTLPRRERRGVVLPPPHAASDFNPRSREGSDTFTIRNVQFSRISIHAPAKGATGWFSPFGLRS